MKLFLVLLLLLTNNLFSAEKSILIAIKQENNINYIEQTNSNLKYNSNFSELDNLSTKYNLDKARKLKQNYPINNWDLYELHFSTDKSISDIIADYNSVSIIEETNELKSFSSESVTGGLTTTTPNDPHSANQLALNVMKFPESWDFNTGSNNIRIAIFDTGLDWYHPDFADNIWQNLGEDADGDGHTIEFNGTNWILDPGDLNGVDDDDFDSNPATYIDDLIGWDFESNDNDPFPENVYTNATHGTQVGSIAGAVGNNGLHTTGTNWDVSLLGLRVELGWISNSIEAIDYCISNDIDIINMSWGSDWFNNSLFHQKIQQAYNDYNILFGSM
jgi:subtilisin family serine protease